MKVRGKSYEGSICIDNVKVEGIIFDLDGTLLDSMSVWDTVGEDYLRSLGIEPRENLAETFKEMSLAQSAAYYQVVYGVEKSEEEIIAGIHDIIARFYIEKASLKAGVKEFLAFFHKKNVKMCIATATEKSLVEKALRRCEVIDFFTEIITCQEVGHGKDEPVIYERALENLGTEKAHTLVFEDAIHAIRTAKNAGFTVVGVYDNSQANQEQVQELSDMYIRDFKDMELSE